MALYAITYDVRKRFPDDYPTLYKQLNDWSAAHLQNSVWLADLRGPAATIRDILLGLIHQDDTICVIQLASMPEWATQKARQSGNDWLRQRNP